MSRSGSLKSYWSYVSNVHNKLSGTQESKIEARKAVRKLIKMKIKTFPTISETRKALKKWNKVRLKMAKIYQKEVLMRGDKISLKKAKLMMPDFDIDGTSSEDFPIGESP